MWRYLKWGFLSTLALIVFLFFEYTLPTHDVVRLVGTEVKRMDVGNAWFWTGLDSGTGNNQSRDVRFINAMQANGKTIVYRNEDTLWGWPPYFKFDGADLSAEAESAVSSEAAPVWDSMRNYGWRNSWFSICPNALSMKVVSGPDVTIIPIFNIVFLGLLAALIMTLRRFFINWRTRRVDPVVAAVAEDLGSGYEALGDKVDVVGAAATGLWGRARRWLKKPPA